MTDTLVRVDAPVSPERVTPLKPSEALRLGRLLRPRRIRGRRFSDPDGACALGAIEVAGGDPWMLWNCSAWCPYGCVAHRDNASDTVWHLNDTHRWSDDQIVAWLESLGL